MREYVEKMLHTKIDSIPATPTVPLPLYIKGLFTFEQWNIRGIAFVVATPEENPSAKTLARRMPMLQSAFGLPVAFAYEDTTGYRMARLIEENVPFVVNERQVYLPFLGIAIQQERKTSLSRPAESVSKVSTQTQRFILRAIYDDWTDINVTQAAKEMGVSKVTVSRAFDELAMIDPDLIVSDKRIRKFCLKDSRKAFWSEMEPYLFNPVVREYHLGENPSIRHVPLSGMSAVARHSMLADSPYPTLAVTKAQEKELGLRSGAGLAEWGEWDQPACVIQVMRYRLDSMEDEAIDPLSAILSLSEEDRMDPRIEGEIEDILRRVFE